jgi:hypothetical protein
MNRLRTTSHVASVDAAPENGALVPGNGHGQTRSIAAENGDPMNTTHVGVFERLAAPFPERCVSFKPQVVQGRNALAIAYLDARVVMDRLDEVLSPGGWQDDYSAMPGGGVKCTLSLKIDGEWISKSDVGSRSDQADEGDQIKAAFSDSLKRAAVRWAVGRYLYHFPKQWVGYDPDRRCFTETPTIPDWALPTDQSSRTQVPPPPTPDQAATVVRANSQSTNPNGGPSDGRALFTWLKQQERTLVEDHRCRPGELVEHVAQAGAAAGHGTQIVRWAPLAVRFGVNAASEFIAQRNGQPDSAA